jgi:hypothetical protein
VPPDGTNCFKDTKADKAKQSDVISFSTGDVGVCLALTSFAFFSITWVYPDSLQVDSENLI